MGKNYTRTTSAYSAQDIARILVRDPHQIIDLITYERICDLYGKGRPFENLSKEEGEAILSLDSAIEELNWLGFTNDQIDVMVDLLRDSFDDLDITNHKPDLPIKTPQERIYMTAFTVAAFPYGPPIILISPYHAMQSYGFSVSKSRNLMQELCRKLETKLMDKRMEIPTLLSTTKVLMQNEIGHLTPDM